MKVVLAILILIPFQALGQSKFWVFFKDKANEVVDFADYDDRVWERRAKQGIPIDELDVPVSRDYIHGVSLLVDSVGYETRWFNAIAVYVGPGEIDEVKKLSYVSGVLEIGGFAVLCGSELDDNGALEIARRQTEMLGAKTLSLAGITGLGVRVAVLDAGFTGVNKHPAFKHIFEHNRIISTYDFLTRKEDVFHGSTHGTMVLSCIAGIYDSIQLGLAPNAEFLLARTEYLWADTRNDEERWIAALEWSERNGADLVNSSLGYTYANHFPYELDGSSMISRAANIAASKGVLVINSAGNEFNNRWKYITLPSDADSLLAVGAVNPFTGLQSGFSSVGPTADGRLKPNVSAPGICAVINGNKLVTVQGTSFSAPLVTGYAACLLQMHSRMPNAIELKELVEKGGSLYPYFDYAHGYGMPEINTVLNVKEPLVSIRTEIIDDKVHVVLLVPPGSAHHESLIFWHIQSSTGRLKVFRVVKAETEQSISLGITLAKIPAKNDIPLLPGEVLRICYQGFIYEMTPD